MVHTGAAGSPPYTQALSRALQSAENTASAADLLLLEAWETNKPMHLGIMLRIRQIRRANPQLSSEIAAELTTRCKATTDASHH
jgi:hypothetical protein